MTAKTSSPVGRRRVLRVAALALLAGVILAGRPAPANAAGPAFDLTTVADKTYEFRLRGHHENGAVLALFGSFHVDASGAIDSAKAWMSAEPGPDFAFQTLTIFPSTLNHVTLKDPDAGVYWFYLPLQSSDFQVSIRAWMKLSDPRGRNGSLHGRFIYQSASGSGNTIGDGEIVSP